jgi:AcrR family transcriptional regulator
VKNNILFNLVLSMTKQDEFSSSKSANRGPAIDIDHVLNTAANLFADHGFDGVSTREIAKACGCSLPIIYYHFSNKQTLYNEAFANRIEDAIDIIRGRMSDDMSARDRLKQLVAGFFDLFTQERSLLLLVQRDIAQVASSQGQFLCRRQHIYFMRFIRDLASEVLGHEADAHTVFTINAMLLGYAEFYHLVNEGGERLPGESDEARIAALQESVLRVLGV